MTLTEIKQKIDENNKKLEESVQVNFFTLNTAVAAILAENAELQELCTHEIQNGKCIYCYKELNNAN